MTDIQNPGAVKPEALREALEEMVAAFGPYAVRPPALTAVTNARAALELQPEPALTDEQIIEQADALCSDMDLGEFWGFEREALLKFAHALGRGVPSSLLEKSEGSFHPVSTSLEEKKP